MGPNLDLPPEKRTVPSTARERERLEVENIVSRRQAIIINQRYLLANPPIAPKLPSEEEIAAIKNQKNK